MSGSVFSDNTTGNKPLTLSADQAAPILDFYDRALYITDTPNFYGPAINTSLDDHRIEETYLDNVIEADYDALTNLRQMYDIFQDDPDTLFEIGYSASDIGDVDLRKADFEKLAIKAYTKILDFYMGIPISL